MVLRGLLSFKLTNDTVLNYSLVQTSINKTYPSRCVCCLCYKYKIQTQLAIKQTCLAAAGIFNTAQLNLLLFSHNSQSKNYEITKGQNRTFTRLKV